MDRAKLAISGAAETSEFYFVPSSVRKSVCTLVRQLRGLASSVDHDEWFRREVEKSRVSAREGRLLDHDEVACRMDRRYRG